MIAQLRGEVVHRDAEAVVVDVGGVGYLVHVAAADEVPARGQAVELHTSLQVREDSMTLYGFGDRDGLRLFELLLSSSGIGPKLALAALRTLRPEVLRTAIAAADTSTLTAIPGVGKKVAERMVLELRDKVGGLGDGDDLVVTTGAGAAATPIGETREALMALGYGAGEVQPVLSQLDPDADVADLLRLALREARTGQPMTPNEAREPERLPGEDGDDASLRPRTLVDFVGQPRVRRQLDLVIRGAVQRGSPPDHVLLSGPPGLGKTSLAAITAHEIGASFRATSGPAVERPGDLAAILTNLDPGDVLFIDEIHRLPRTVEEVLYSAMEDFQIDIVVGKGPAARSIKLDLPPFTLVGATTRTGLIASPLRDRFGFSAHLDYYDVGHLEQIVARSAGLLGIEVDADGGREIARRSRGTPRIANRLLRRVRDYAEVEGDGAVDAAVARAALDVFDVDEVGLDRLDQRVLGAIVEQFAGGPVGLTTLATAVGEEPDTVEDAVEPFLIQLGMIQRTPRGRVATLAAYDHLGVAPPVDTEHGVPSLFEE